MGTPRRNHFPEFTLSQDVLKTGLGMHYVTVSAVATARILLTGLVALLSAGCGTMQNAASSIGISLEFPALEQIGYSTYGHAHTVVNNTPFFAVVVVYGAAVALLRPGEGVKDTRHWEPLRPQIPTAILFYRDKERRTYIGCASQILNYANPSRTAQTWIVSTRDVRTPSASTPTIASTTEILPTTWKLKEADFPTESWNETAAIQIINNTNFTMTVSVNGELKAHDLSSGGYYYTGRRRITVSDDPRVAVHLRFTDDVRQVGTYEFHTSITQGVTAHQLIIDNHTIPR